MANAGWRRGRIDRASVKSSDVAGSLVAGRNRGELLATVTTDSGPCVGFDAEILTLERTLG